MLNEYSAIACYLLEIASLNLLLYFALTYMKVPWVIFSVGCGCPGWAWVFSVPGCRNPGLLDHHASTLERSACSSIKDMCKPLDRRGGVYWLGDNISYLWISNFAWSLHGLPSWWVHYSCLGSNELMRFQRLCESVSQQTWIINSLLVGLVTAIKYRSKFRKWYLRIL